MKSAVRETESRRLIELLPQVYEELLRPYPSVELCDWSSFNRAVGGFRAREFSILCGSTGAGKTTFLANISAQLLKSGVKHFVMSVETGHTDFVKRVMSVLYGRDINTGAAMGPDALASLHAQFDKLLESDTLELSLYENRVSSQQLIHDLQFMHAKGCKIAMIDNLNFFLEVTRAQDAIIEMDRVIHDLIILCKQIDMHVVMVMHPKKTDGVRVMSEYDIKGSSTAVQEAHNVFLFNRPDPKDVENGVRHASDREVRIAKMRRRGTYVGHTLVFENRHTRYVEADKPWA